MQKYQNEFNTNVAMAEIYKYAKRYRPQVSSPQCEARGTPALVSPAHPLRETRGERVLRAPGRLIVLWAWLPALGIQATCVCTPPNVWWDQGGVLGPKLIPLPTAPPPAAPDHERPGGEPHGPEDAAAAQI